MATARASLAPTRRRPAAALLAPMLLAGAALATTSACREQPALTPVDTLSSAAAGVATGFSTTAKARFVNTILGFQGPESVRYDPDQDVFFVSNMAGYGSAKDGNGFITRVSAADPNDAVIFAQGGRDGVVLNAPKGMALHGDTLWVADIDALRAFDRRSGAPLATIDFAPQHPVQLNDVAVGPDGTIRVTDTGIVMSRFGNVHTGPDRIFEVGPGGAVSTVASGLELRLPNGITWDPHGRRWIVVSFDPFAGDVAAMPAQGASRQLLFRAKGRLDGVEVLSDGSILYTSWADSSVHLLAGSQDRQLLREVPEAADLGVDTRRGRIAVPLATLDRVQLWSLDAARRAP